MLTKRDEDSSDNFCLWSDQPASYISSPLRSIFFIFVYAEDQSGSLLYVHIQERAPSSAVTARMVARVALHRRDGAADLDVRRAPAVGVHTSGRRKLQAME